MIRLRKAAEADIPAVCRFYREVCEAQAHEPYGPDWHWGIYPDEEELAACVREGVLFLAETDGAVAAAAVLRAGEDPMYLDVPWHAKTGAVRVLHLFAVHPAFRGRGLGRKTLAALLKSVAEDGAAVHLDVVKGNLPAERLYGAMGFRFIEEREIFYEDTGLITVRLYEHGPER